MKKYEYIFFDMDGTLTDSELGIVNCFKNACDEFSLDYSKIDMKTILGPPLMDSFMALSGDRQISQKAVAYYRAHFNPQGMLYENKLYDGVLEMLENLKEMRYKLFIATSKPEIFALEIAEYFGIQKFFSGIFGGLLDGTRINKDDVLDFALGQAGNKRESSVMIGDRMYDLSAANEFGVDAIGVLYGYGTREELEKYDYVLLADKPSDVTDFFRIKK